MNSNSRSKPRPLGSMRHSLTIMDSVPKFPPLQTEKLDRNYQGISGSAMTVPTRSSIDTERNYVKPETPKSQKVQKKPESPQRTITSSKSDSTSSKSDPDNKELKDAMVREKQLKQKIMSLQKVIDELKVQVNAKEKTITELQEQFARQEEYYKELYEKEQHSHAETKSNLENTQHDLKAKIKEIEELKTKHTQEIKDLSTQMEGKYKKMCEEKDKEIGDRDEKIKRLKQHMADALKGNSWERQQQIDELTKELTRTQEEVENLRLKIKAVKKEKSSDSQISSTDTDLKKAQQR